MVVARLANRFNRRSLERQAVFQLDRLLASPGRRNDIMSGLVPIGDTGLYGTPATPADPTDCARYPDSPYCGGNPISIRLVAIDFGIVRDNCNVGIRLNPILGFIRLPPIAIVYRYPECRNPPPRPQPPEGDYSEPVKIPPHNCDGLNVSTATLVLRSLHSHQEIPYDNDTRRAIIDVTQTAQLLNFQHPYRGDHVIIERVYTESGYVDIPTKPITSFTLKREWRVEANKDWVDGVWHGVLPIDGEYDGENFSHKLSETLTFYPSPSLNENLYSNFSTYLWQGSYQQAINVLQNSRNNKVTRVLGSHVITEENNYEVHIRCGIGPPTPPLPPLNNNDDPMDCCDLVRLVLVKVNKLSEIVGVDEFPAKMPKRLVYPSGQGEIEIKSVIQALGYQVRQIDKAVGYLPQKIKVADVNAAQPGNQSVEVDIHSFADFARETLQYLIDTEGDDDTLTNIAVRILYECGAIHQTSVQGAAMLDCIVEFLDFKEKWKTIKVPFAFDPYAGQKGKKAGRGFGKDTDQKGKPIPLTEEELEKMLPALLKEAEVEIRVLENEQTKSLNDVLQEILKDARIAAAGVSDTASGDRLEQLVNSAQAILQLQNAIDRNNVRKGLTSGDLRTRKKPK